MINTYAKGNRIEKELREAYERNGHITWKPSRARFNSNDIFGEFDFIALSTKPNQKGTVALVQVKSNVSDFYSARTEIAEWLEKNKPNADMLLQVALRIEKNQYRFWSIRFDGYYDEKFKEKAKDMTVNFSEPKSKAQNSLHFELSSD